LNSIDWDARLDIYWIDSSAKVARKEVDHFDSIQDILSRAGLSRKKICGSYVLDKTVVFFMKTDIEYRLGKGAGDLICTPLESWD